MASSLFTATLLATAATLASAQSSLQDTRTGNPSAATGLSFDQPTSSWSQWQPKPTYAYKDLPDQYMGEDRGAPLENGFQPDQSGYNRCLQGENSWNVNSTCQTAWINSIDDWCIWGPPVAGVEVGSFERVAVAYCTAPTHGTRLIPDGTLTGVHFVMTPDYVQVTGEADFTSIGFVQGDTGGEMDPHGEDDLMNPIGGVVYTTARPGQEGTPVMLREWTNFISWNQFLIKGCWGENAAAQCQHIYDVMGAYWNAPANYSAGFESCDGDIGMLAGIYGTSTFRQGDPVSPDPHPIPSSSNCVATSTIGNGGLLLNNALAAASAPTSSAAASATGASSGMQSSRSTAGGSAAAPTRTGGSSTSLQDTTSGASIVQGNGALIVMASVFVGLIALVGTLSIGSRR